VLTVNQINFSVIWHFVLSFFGNVGS